MSSEAPVPGSVFVLGAGGCILTQTTITTQPRELLLVGHSPI